MAMPFDHADLAKLKGFVEFVGSNPTILNMPQLSFVKQFIEQFGGKVPAGDFKMPGAGKCPFGGAKAETKPEVPSEESEDEVLSDSEPESELELNMEERAGSAASNKRENDKDESKENAANTVFLKENSSYNCLLDVDDVDCTSTDPIQTSNCAEVLLPQTESAETDARKLRQKLFRNCRADKLKTLREPLIKHPKVKRPRASKCPAFCLQKCKEKFDAKARQQICTAFQQLSAEERMQYLLDCLDMRNTVSRVKVLKVRQGPRSFSNKYFLKNVAGERIRVCVTFFLATLNINRKLVKNAMEFGKTAAAAATAAPSNAAAAAESALNKPPTKFGWNKGKIIKKARLPQPINCSDTCQMKCATHFTAEQRQQICATFWSMDYKRRKDFVLARLETREVSRLTTKEFRKTNRAARTFSNKYFLRGQQGKNVRVCANFFMSTLCIGRKIINNALRHVDQQTGAYVGEDKRGKSAPVNKIPEEMLNEVKRHIESYPTWVPHKGHKTRFLHSSLNIRKMYREYKQQCQQQQRKFVSACYFSNVFHKHFRLAFLKPSSKHAHKISPNNTLLSGANMPNAAAAAATAAVRKINPNVSEFTGQEGGGYWIQPTTETQQLNVDNPAKQTMSEFVENAVSANYWLPATAMRENYVLAPPVDDANHAQQQADKTSENENSAITTAAYFAPSAGYSFNYQEL